MDNNNNNNIPCYPLDNLMKLYDDFRAELSFVADELFDAYINDFVDVVAKKSISYIDEIVNKISN